MMGFPGLRLEHAPCSLFPASKSGWRRKRRKVAVEVADMYSVCITDGSWSDEDSQDNLVLPFYGKSWDEMLTLIRWATAEGYEVIISKDTGGGGHG